MSSGSSSLLWKQYQSGDRQAFGQLYRAYHPRLTLYCLGLLKDKSLAEDAASETLQKMLQHSDPSEIREFEKWIFTVAKNSCLNLLNKHNRQREIRQEMTPLLKTVNRAEGEDALREQQLMTMRKETLSEAELNIWDMHEAGYNNREIAGELKMVEKTVANLKSSARNKLRTLVKKWMQ